MHVFSDLMPYICTFDGCPHKLRCFPSRSAWAHHEFEEHRLDRYWACPECPRKSCSTLDWEHHLNNVHNQKFSGSNLVSARNTACRISPKRAEEEQCPLCRVVLGKPRRALIRHVSRHMEDIALMALPSNAEEDSEIGSISTNHTSNEGNDTSKDLHIDEEYTIKCICGFKYDDGNTVYCERCDTWQHTGCYYLDEGGVVPTKEVLSSIDHFCADCKPRPLDVRAAIKRLNKLNTQPSPSPDYLPPPERSPTPERTSSSDVDSSKMQEDILREIRDEGILDGIDLDNLDVLQEDELSERIAEAYRRRHHLRARQQQDTSDRPQTPDPREQGSDAPEQQHHRRSGRSPNPPESSAHSSHPPLSRPHLLEAYPRSKPRKRRRRPKAEASQGDAVLIGYMGGLNHPDLASKAGEEPLDQESEESTDEDEVESESGSDSNQLLPTAVPGVERGISPKDHLHGPSSNKSTEAPHLELDGDAQTAYYDAAQEKSLSHQEANFLYQRLQLEDVDSIVKHRVMRRVCDDCRRLKRKVSVLTGWGGQYCG